MAKVKYDSSKKDPNFKIGELPEVKGATNVVTAAVVEIANGKEDIKKSPIVDSTCVTVEEERE